MKRLFIAVVLVAAFAGCGNSEFRFEQIDGTVSSPLPFKLESVQGLRDGDSVKAEARFSNGSDAAQMHMVLHLGPPAQFVSGTYRSSIGGKVSEGVVACTSLTYLGGQANLPSIGGVFLFNDSQGRVVYRVVMPPTPLTRLRN